MFSGCNQSDRGYIDAEATPPTQFIVTQLTLTNKMDEFKRQFDIIGRHFIFTTDKSTGVSDILSAGKSGGLSPMGPLFE